MRVQETPLPPPPPSYSGPAARLPPSASSELTHWGLVADIALASGRAGVRTTHTSEDDDDDCSGGGGGDYGGEYVCVLAGCVVRECVRVCYACSLSHTRLLTD